MKNFALRPLLLAGEEMGPLRSNGIGEGHMSKGTTMSATCPSPSPRVRLGSPSSPVSQERTLSANS